MDSLIVNLVDKVSSGSTEGIISLITIILIVVYRFLRSRKIL